MRERLSDEVLRIRAISTATSDSGRADLELAAQELIERRAADLSVTDMEALRWARTELVYKSQPGDGEGYREQMKRALVVLNRLIAP